MVKVLVLFVFGAVAALLMYAAMKPDRFRVTRSALIPAPPARVFGLINDLSRWQGWSPWEGRDPALKRTYSGPQEGVGAAYAWAGNNKVGEGRMEIIEAVADETIVLKLDFLKPFEAHNTAAFTLQPEADGTRVTWTMEGPQPFMGKVMDAVMNMDRMVGKDFAQGLSNLAAAASRAA